MSFSEDYREKLKHPLWQKKRLEILQAANFSCEDCGKSDEELHVHHCIYVKGREPWEYNRNTLIAVCHDCHKWRQEFELNARHSLALLLRYSSLDNVRRAADFLYGLVQSNPNCIPRRKGDYNENP